MPARIKDGHAALLVRLQGFSGWGLMYRWLVNRIDSTRDRKVKPDALIVFISFLYIAWIVFTGRIPKEMEA